MAASKKQSTGPRENSLAWRIARLEVGRFELMPITNPDSKTTHASSAELAIKRNKIPGKFKVRMCCGYTADLEERPFRFVRIERIA